MSNFPGGNPFIPKKVGPWVRPSSPRQTDNSQMTCNQTIDTANQKLFLQNCEYKRLYITINGLNIESELLDKMSLERLQHRWNSIWLLANQFDQLVTSVLLSNSNQISLLDLAFLRNLLERIRILTENSIDKHHQHVKNVSSNDSNVSEPSIPVTPTSESLVATNSQKKILKYSSIEQVFKHLKSGLNCPKQRVENISPENKDVVINSPDSNTPADVIVHGDDRAKHERPAIVYDTDGVAVDLESLAINFKQVTQKPKPPQPIPKKIHADIEPANEVNELTLEPVAMPLEHSNLSGHPQLETSGETKKTLIHEKQIESLDAILCDLNFKNMQDKILEFVSLAVTEIQDQIVCVVEFIIDKIIMNDSIDLNLYSLLLYGLKTQLLEMPKKFEIFNEAIIHHLKRSFYEAFAGNSQKLKHSERRAYILKVITKFYTQELLDAQTVLEVSLYLLESVATLPENGRDDYVTYFQQLFHPTGFSLYKETIEQQMNSKSSRMYCQIHKLLFELKNKAKNLNLSATTIEIINGSINLLENVWTQMLKPSEQKIEQ